MRDGLQQKENGRIIHYKIRTVQQARRYKRRETAPEGRKGKRGDEKRGDEVNIKQEGLARGKLI